MRKYTFLVFILAIILSILILHTNKIDKEFKILFVSSYNAKTFDWVKEQEKGVKRAFQNKKIPIEYKVFYMDTKKYNTEEEKIKRGQIAQNIIRTWSPDITITSDENATLYVAIPMKDTKYKFIFCAMNNNPSAYNLPMSNITGVYEKYHYKEAIKVLKMIDPNAKTFAVLTEKTESSDVLVELLKQDIKNLPVNFIDIQKTSSFETWKKLVLNYKNKIDALMVLVPFSIKDAKGNLISGEEIMQWTEANLNVPIISVFDFTTHTLLSVYGSGFSQGYIAGDMAIKSLKGEDFSNIKIQQAKDGIINIDANRAKRFKFKIPPILLESSTIK